MSDDINRKRAVVADISPNPSWKKKVSRMPDSQIIAIYLKEQAKAEKPESEKEKQNEDDIPF